MKSQQIILLGTVVWLAGVILDSMVTRYAYLLIHLGTLIAIFGCYKWLRVSENRKQISKYFFPRGGFREKIKNIFDFSWSRVSILWTFCLLMGMLIVHIGSLALGSSAAYKEAVKTIKMDDKVLTQTGEILDFSYMVTGNSTPRGRSTLNIGVIGSEKNIKVIAIVHGSDDNYITKRIEIKN
ncbi:MAG: hypothetical protein GQ574_26375 [Crocinitomix sp.]|nr:hypothetical protein [Crocinitomix sp.]